MLLPFKIWRNVEGSGYKKFGSIQIPGITIIYYTRSRGSKFLFKEKVNSKILILKICCRN